jgi:hypothetical protein
VAFDNKIHARWVRVIPKTWYSFRRVVGACSHLSYYESCDITRYTHICLRVEFYGCTDTVGPTGEKGQKGQTVTKYTFGEFIIIVDFFKIDTCCKFLLKF